MQKNSNHNVQTFLNIIEISDESEKVNAKNLQNSQIIKLETKPNNFNLKNINIVKLNEMLISDTNRVDFTILNIQNNQDKINPQSNLKFRSITYMLEGDTRYRYSTDKNLIMKLNKQQQNNKKIVETESDKQQKQQKSNEEEKNNALVRYFTNISETLNVGKCRRCKKKGHYQRNCTQEIRVSCYFCLGNHSCHQCSRRTCFRCNQQGHMAKDCKLSSVQCNKCEKIGHKQNECGSIILFEVYRFDERDLQKSRCLACNKKGHYNCHKYFQRGDNLYRQENNEDKSTKYKRKNDRDIIQLEQQQYEQNTHSKLKSQKKYERGYDNYFETNKNNKKRNQKFEGKKNKRYMNYQQYTGENDRKKQSQSNSKKLKKSFSKQKNPEQKNHELNKKKQNYTNQKQRIQNNKNKTFKNKKIKLN